MSVDRRISLETSIPQGMPDLSQSGTGTRREPTDAERQAFSRAMADEAAGTPEADAPMTPRPFALFGAAAMAAPSAPSGAPEGLAENLAEAADQLLVGDGSTGRREVRVVLKDEILPGVTLSVHEEAGRLVAAFTCASEASRERLCACAQALAAEMAQSLQRPALVRVATDDPEDPCLLEEAAEPGAP